jgi:predicted esterase
MASASTGYRPGKDGYEMRQVDRMGWAAMCVFLLATLHAGLAVGERVFMKDGRILQGNLMPIEGVAEAPKPLAADGSGPLQTLLMIDDGLRRTFVSKQQYTNIGPDAPAELLEKFRLDQRVMQSGQEIMSIGVIAKTQPFDEFGRRILTIMSPKGPINVIQCITEITPLYTKIEGHNFVWDMRVATSSIDREVLSKILAKQIDPADIEDRKKIARFYLQCERYEEAAAELDAVLAAFPDDAAVREQLEPSTRALKQLGAKRLLKELELRAQAGQHTSVFEMLNRFPSDGVAGEILQVVKEKAEEYKSAAVQRKELLEKFDDLLAKIGDAATRQKLAPVREELFAEVNMNTLDRMSAFRQHADDEDLLPDERVALAVSGWLIGSNSATENLPVATSLFEVREMIREYVNTADTLARARILEQLRSQEGAAVSYAAKIIALMKPTLDTPPAEEKPGYYELEVKGLNPAESIEYLVQLPPEYDAHRRYPTIVALHRQRSDATRQVDWWAGPWREGGWRAGQASRHGYIVVAPNWAEDGQREYEYSAREHAAVLYCLRDAFRRFSIDTDRVFLAGHSMGGDAAWDIGLAHPDLWAGVIPITANSDRYCTYYWKNAFRLPFYVIGGEKDGRWMVDNARDLDRFLRARYNATVVEFRGRGHENFSDEILRLFDWMGNLKRDFFPSEFAVKSMRPGDSFFWWLELQGLSARSMVNPFSWPPGRGTRASIIEGKVTPGNSVIVKAKADRVVIWLTPEMVDFEKPVNITLNGRRVKLPAADESGRSPSERRRPSARPRFPSPSLETLLEDVRTRADRRHPFWVKVESWSG